jgi:CheY-like chemotaxis protein
VDDDLPICELLEMAFAEEGWDVQTRTHPREALELLRQWTADVILLDVRMPEMGAETFLARYRQQVKQDIPIILLSASSNLDSQAARLGVSGTVTKPFDIDDLCMTVRQFVPDQMMSAVGGASSGR